MSRWEGQVLWSGSTQGGMQAKWPRTCLKLACDWPGPKVTGASFGAHVHIEASARWKDDQTQRACSGPERIYHTNSFNLSSILRTRTTHE